MRRAKSEFGQHGCGARAHLPCGLVRTAAHVPLGLVMMLTSPVLAQFAQPAGTSVRQRVAGQLLRAEGAPTPESGDEIGAFLGNQVVGRQVLGSGSTAANQFSFVIFGDDPATTAVEGPRRGQAVTFRFFDASANQVRQDVRIENAAGEPFNYTYAGAELPPIDLPGGIDLTPTQSLNLRLGVQQGGGGGGGGGGDDAGRFDVNQDGQVNTDDAALILRAVVSGRTTSTSSESSTSGTGATSGTGSSGTGSATGSGAGTVAAAETAPSRLDVNGDGRVTTQDAIEVLRR